MTQVKSEILNLKSEILFMRRAAKIAGNTKCWIGIGCVIAKDGKILSEAWNETLKGEEYCVGYRARIKKGVSLPYAKETPDQKPKDNLGCIRHELGLRQGKEIDKACSIHAEILAIIRSASQGKLLAGSTIFVTSFPCPICMRAIIASGIKKIIYMNDFYKPHHEELFKKNGIKVEKIPEEKVWGYQAGVKSQKSKLQVKIKKFK